MNSSHKLARRLLELPDLPVAIDGLGFQTQLHPEVYANEVHYNDGSVEVKILIEVASFDVEEALDHMVAMRKRGKCGAV